MINFKDINLEDGENDDEHVFHGNITVDKVRPPKHHICLGIHDTVVGGRNIEPQGSAQGCPRIAQGPSLSLTITIFLHTSVLVRTHVSSCVLTFYKWECIKSRTHND